MKTITTGQTGESVQTVQTAENVGDTSVNKKTVVRAEQMDQKEFTLAKVNQALWLGIHLIGLVIALRFAFLLFNANLTGFSLLVYNLSTPLVRLFQGIFPAPSAGGAYFDSAALLALAMWYVFGYIVTYILRLLSNDVTEASP